MAVYFRFKSSKVIDSVPIDGPFITVGELKETIIDMKQLIRKGRNSSDSDIVVSNYESEQDYLDHSTLIPRNATVLVRRVPVRASLPIIVNPPPVLAEPDVIEKDPDDLEWDELVKKVINSDPENYPSRSGNPTLPTTEMDEDSRIKALVETQALKWLGSVSGGFGQKMPPPGYICHRCKIAGHLIQHCPTNGDPDYDIKRLRPPSGIPKSILVATPDGSYALPGGAVAVLRPDEDAFEKAMEGVPSSSRSVGQLPPELHCRLCKQVMKDAVLTSRCCFDSFCDRCIRGHIINKCSCVCGATDVLADHLTPNLTLRGTISSILESKSSSSSRQSAENREVESVSVKESAPAPSQESDVQVEKKGMQPGIYGAYSTGFGFVPMNMPFWGTSGMGFNAEVSKANGKRNAMLTVVTCLH